jgi:prolipoprotein diacylglyceryltransferase
VTYRDALAPAAHPMLARHPWPLYEAGCLLLLAALFAAPRHFAAFPGRRAAMYVMMYAIVRGLLEALRGDPQRGVFFHASYSVSQLIAVVTGAAALGFLRHAKPAAAESPLCARSLQV